MKLWGKFVNAENKLLIWVWFLKGKIEIVGHSGKLVKTLKINKLLIWLMEKLKLWEKLAKTLKIYKLLILERLKKMLPPVTRFKTQKLKVVSTSNGCQSKFSNQPSITSVPCGQCGLQMSCHIDDFHFSSWLWSRSQISNFARKFTTAEKSRSFWLRTEKVILRVRQDLLPWNIALVISNDQSKRSNDKLNWDCYKKTSRK